VLGLLPHAPVGETWQKAIVYLDRLLESRSLVLVPSFGPAPPDHWDPRDPPIIGPHAKSQRNTMNWYKTRSLLRGSRSQTEETSVTRPGAPNRAPLVRAGSICVASGKGGTGKSMVTASLASEFSGKGKTLIVDADMGVGNAHIMQNVSPAHSFVDVIESEMPVREVLQSVNARLDLLAAGSGVSHMAGLSTYEMHLVGCGLELLEVDYDSLVVDSAAGISRQTVALAAASDVVLIVTTPDVTALTDAYAFLKVFLRRKPEVSPLLVVNRVSCYEEADKVAQRMCSVSRRFLGRAPRYVGCLPYDEAAVKSINARSPVVEHMPNSRLACSLRDLAVTLREELARHSHKGLGRQLLRSVGYTPGR